MAFNFSANQFEHEYRPRRLGNWQVPKWYPERPSKPRGPTTPIADDRGHLLTGVRRGPRGPWGDYRGTWQLPRRITRRAAEELAAPPKPLTSWEKRSASHIPLPGAATASQSKIQERPPSLTRPKTTPPVLSPPLQPVTGTPPTRPTPPPATIAAVAEATTTSTPPPPLGLSTSCLKPIDLTPPPSTPKPLAAPPLAGAYSNFQLAKKQAQDNLRHQPLPDTVEDALYRRGKVLGGELAVEPRSAAVGWRGWGGAAPGPTQCSKMRVYRPRKPADTSPSPSLPPAAPHPPPSADASPIQLALCWDLRPSSPALEPKPTTHIDGSNGSAAPAVFALVPPLPPPVKDAWVETRASSASSGGGKDKGNGKKSGGGRPCSGSNCGTSDANSGNGSRDKARKTSGDSSSVKRAATEGSDGGVSKHPRSKSAAPRSSASGVRRKSAAPSSSSSGARSKSAAPGSSGDCTLASRSKSATPSFSSSGASATRKKSVEPKATSSPTDRNNNVAIPKGKPPHYRSSPNLRAGCTACEKGEAPPLLPPAPYKMAFKAGSPEACNTVRAPPPSVKVPKPRAPFARRSYSIDTLAPPFSVWSGSQQGYPEHWRLASVYQHSFKPLEARRKPLLASVYQ